MAEIRAYEDVHTEHVAAAQQAVTAAAAAVTGPQPIRLPEVEHGVVPDHGVRPGYTRSQ